MERKPLTRVTVESAKQELAEINIEIRGQEQKIEVLNKKIDALRHIYRSATRTELMVERLETRRYIARLKATIRDTWHLTAVAAMMELEQMGA